MEKITPCLWFDSNAEEAVKFYTSLFKDSKVISTAKYDKASSKVSGQPAGSIMTVNFSLAGENFLALNGGPIFKFTPATSLYVSCKSEKEIDSLWSQLSNGGSQLMPLSKYPFSKKYGWLTDRFGLSWQLNFAEGKQKIIPALMFCNVVQGKASEAIKFYTKTFKKSKVNLMANYEKGEPGPIGQVKHARFLLDGYEFIAMDSCVPQNFSFTHAMSFIINCKDQQEIDLFWEAFSNEGKIEQCGWVLDKYGLPWQVVPQDMEKLMSGKKGEKVMRAMLQMKKLDLAKLKAAAN